MDKKIENKRLEIENIIKNICFGFLCITVLTLIITVVIVNASNPKFINNEIYLKVFESTSDMIYGINSILCVLSIILHIIYICVHFWRKSKEKIKTEIKTFCKKEWPVVLLGAFLVWTSFGCIQAAIESGAENKLRAAYEEVEAGKRADLEGMENIIEITKWSKGDRAPNAADRAWNGCNNLKDGYFSFMFYGTVLVNILIIGKDEKYKKLLLRILMMSMFILTLLTLFNLIDDNFLGQGIIGYNRGIFRNSNHYGYFLCISVLLAATMFIKEKNLYFIGMGFLSFLLSTYMLILNNTFGSYLGVLIAMIWLGIDAIIQLVKNIKNKENKKIVEFVKVCIILVPFIIFSTLETDPNNIENKTPIVVNNFNNLSKDMKVWTNAIFKDKKKNSEKEESKDKNKEIRDEVSNTGSGRGEVWIGSLELIRQKPFIGWGLENMLHAFYGQLGINEGRTHNLILQLAGTTGIVGMLMYVTAIVAIGIRILKRRKEWDMISYSAFFCFVSYMVSSMFGNSAFYTSPYFMIILGMVITAFWNREKEEKVSGKK